MVTRKVRDVNYSNDSSNNKDAINSRIASNYIEPATGGSPSTTVTTATV